MLVEKEIKPQDGPQSDFLNSEADIVIYGGAAGGGKTYALLLEALWHYQTPGFSAVVFRKNANQVRNPGGLWDNAAELFMQFQGEPKISAMEWHFPFKISGKIRPYGSRTRQIFLARITNNTHRF